MTGLKFKNHTRIQSSTAWYSGPPKFSTTLLASQSKKCLRNKLHMMIKRHLAMDYTAAKQMDDVSLQVKRQSRVKLKCKPELVIQIAVGFH